MGLPLIHASCSCTLLGTHTTTFTDRTSLKGAMMYPIPFLGGVRDSRQIEFCSQSHKLLLLTLYILLTALPKSYSRIPHIRAMIISTSTRNAHFIAEPGSLMLSYAYGVSSISSSDSDDEKIITPKYFCISPPVDGVCSGLSLTQFV